MIVDYTAKKKNVKTLIPIKIISRVDKRRQVPFAVLRDSTLSSEEIKRLFGNWFVIKTYYRMMYHFLAFSGSQHPTVRFIIVFGAF
ncbi:MAG: hypothetical protein ACFFD4_32025 [Candidatus Odinarchaeota archaeon]